MQFDVAEATLKANFPEIHERVFLNLGKTSGQAVVVSVTTLLNRLDELEQQTGDADGVAALALLAKRGLDQDARQEARGLLARIGDLAPPNAEPAEPTNRQLRAKAEAAMWAWFMEWATIARTVVPDKRLRIYMGISKPTQTSPEDTSDNDHPHHPEPVAPNPTPPMPPAPPAPPSPPTPVTA